MVLNNTFEYMVQPLDPADIRQLKITAVCGFTVLIMIMIGLPKLLVLLCFLLIVGIIVVITWLYALEDRKRQMVIERIKEVLNSFWQTCVNDAMSDNDKASNSSTESSKPLAKNNVLHSEKENNANVSDNTVGGLPPKAAKQYSELFK